MLRNLTRSLIVIGLLASSGCTLLNIPDPSYRRDREEDYWVYPPPDGPYTPAEIREH